MPNQSVRSLNVKESKRNNTGGNPALINDIYTEVN